MNSKFTIIKHTFPGQHVRQFAGANRYRDEDVQYLEVKQYTPLDSPKPQEGDLTIIGTCAVSFPKEMYEPLWDDLLECIQKQGLRIRSIWVVDKSDHAASAVLNEHTQGDDPSSSDLARDLLNMINLFRDQITLPIVGIGHSLGATALLELAQIHPRLFASLVVIDPIIGPDIWRAGVVLVNASARRPDLWSSREEAERFFKSAKSLQKWDSRVFDQWLKYGLRDTPTLLHPEPGMVTLATTKAIESWNYCRSWFDPLPADGQYRSERSMIKYPDAAEDILKTYPFYRAEAREVWDLLPRMRTSLLYVFPAGSTLSTPEAMREKVQRTGTGAGGSGGEDAGRTARAVVAGGHLVPFEKPAECASLVAEWLTNDLRAWKEGRDFEREHQDAKSVDKIALSDEWVRRARKWFEDHAGKFKAKL